MDITYLGHSSFKLKGKTATVVTDPYDPQMVGMKFPKVDTHIVTVSHHHQDHDAVSQVGGTPFVVDGPGEYEIQGVSIVGIHSFHDNNKGKDRGENVIFVIDMDGIHLVHLGDLGHMLTEKDLEEIGTVDILFIPIGGVYTINEKQAVEMIAEIDPSIVIPMHYGRPELKQDVFGQLSPLTSFLKLLGYDQVVPQQKLSITKDKIPDQTQIIVFQ
ncbi:MAG: MBL fold metallo-hydrolase [Patescibacteria group bacterium]|nr:MBL fold metallo-hydrolase [Patescibacteria group bacterium]